MLLISSHFNRTFINKYRTHTDMDTQETPARRVAHLLPQDSMWNVTHPLALSLEKTLEPEQFFSTCARIHDEVHFRYLGERTSAQRRIASTPPLAEHLDVQELDFWLDTYLAEHPLTVVSSYVQENAPANHDVIPSIYHCYNPEKNQTSNHFFKKEIETINTLRAISGRTQVDRSNAEHTSCRSLEQQLAHDIAFLFYTSFSLSGDHTSLSLQYRRPDIVLSKTRNHSNPENGTFLTSYALVPSHASVSNYVNMMLEYFSRKEAQVTSLDLSTSLVTNDVRIPSSLKHLNVVSCPLLTELRLDHPIDVQYTTPPTRVYAPGGALQPSSFLRDPHLILGQMLNELMSEGTHPLKALAQSLHACVTLDGATFGEMGAHSAYVVDAIEQGRSPQREDLELARRVLRRTYATTPTPADLRIATLADALAPHGVSSAQIETLARSFDSRSLPTRVITDTFSGCVIRLPSGDYAKVGSEQELSREAHYYQLAALEPLLRPITPQVTAYTANTDFSVLVTKDTQHPNHLSASDIHSYLTLRSHLFSAYNKHHGNTLASDSDAIDMFNLALHHTLMKKYAADGSFADTSRALVLPFEVLEERACSASSDVRAALQTLRTSYERVAANDLLLPISYTPTIIHGDPRLENRFQGPFRPLGDYSFCGVGSPIQDIAWSPRGVEYASFYLFCKRQLEKTIFGTSDHIVERDDVFQSQIMRLAYLNTVRLASFTAAHGREYEARKYVRSAQIMHPLI